MKVKKNTINNNSSLMIPKFNERIRSLRKSKGWSQTELGIYLSEVLHLSSAIPTSTVASWEHKDANISKIPSEDKIIGLSELFHVTPDYLQGLTNLPTQSLSDILNNPPNLKPIKVIPQELPQHFGEPFWISSSNYNGWMLLTLNFTFIDAYGQIHSLDDLLSFNAIFSVFPPYFAYQKHIYNHEVITLDDIRYYDRVWVTIISPDSKMQLYNGWYNKLPDGSGVSGKTILSYDSYFDFWIAYSSPIKDNDI